MCLIYDFSLKANILSIQTWRECYAHGVVNDDDGNDEDDDNDDDDDHDGNNVDDDGVDAERWRI